MKKDDILNQQQVSAVTQLLRSYRGDVVEHAERLGISVEDTVRYMSVASRLREARESAGLSVKDIAKRLKCPQYRIRDAESSDREVVGEVLERYVSLVGLREWYKEWSRNNPELAKRISLQQAGRKKAKSAGTSRRRRVQKSSGS